MRPGYSRSVSAILERLITLNSQTPEGLWPHFCPSICVHQLVRRTLMEVRRFTGSAEAYHTHYLKKSVLNYLNGQYDWKWIMAILRQSGMASQR